MVFIVRMNTMPLQGFAQVRDPTRLDARGGGGSSGNMKSFIYMAQASRVIFGLNSLENIEREVVHMGAQRALVLSTPEQRPEAAVMHVPIESARAARDLATQLGADCAVAIGGGSTTGLAKAIALESPLPIIAIPTTYAGSEMTSIYGLTEDGIKRTGRDLRVLPRTVIYDPALTTSLPVGLLAASGMNAIAHAVEGLYAQDSNPVISLLAEEGIRAMALGLRRVVVAPNDLEARSDCLYGAWLCGIVLGGVGIALHHKLCHTLGGSFNLPHAETHAVVLPHAVAFNAPAAPEEMQRIGRALGAESEGARSAAVTSRLGPWGPRSRPRFRPRDVKSVLEPPSLFASGHPRVAPARLRG